MGFARDPFGIRAGSVGDPREVRSGSTRGPFGVRARSVWDPRGVRSGTARSPFSLVQGPFGIRAGSVRGPFGVRLGSVRGPFGIRSGSVRDPKTHINYCELTLGLMFEVAGEQVTRSGAVETDDVTGLPQVPRELMSSRTS